ncbi:MAG: aminotransferase class I/II-fold pyridoxal phosphate-dependent enzyme, partial [Verrucomicrobiales bacterium]|nr:aminotransferase class I/II-fold pyridoxal phosphate-dependent enzyme [Verrucomicrobiales bacterium]
LEALENGATEMESMRRAYAQRRNLLLGRFEKMGVPCFAPGGAFYAFPDIRKFGLTSDEFARKLLEEENVAVVPGNAFGEAGEGCVRACYATSYEKLEIALERIANFVNRL